MENNFFMKTLLILVLIFIAVAFSEEASEWKAAKLTKRQDFAADQMFSRSLTSLSSRRLVCPPKTGLCPNNKCCPLNTTCARKGCCPRGTGECKDGRCCRLNQQCVPGGCCPLGHGRCPHTRVCCPFGTKCLPNNRCGRF
jgi:hypothetical protein